MRKRTASSIINIGGRRAEPARPTKGAAGRKSERGIALILTLAILVLVTLLVVAFAVSMRVENTASKNFNDLLKARQLAQAGVDEAVATIRQATTRSTTITNYVTFPGGVYDYNPTNVPPTTLVPLYSTNNATPAPASLNTINLNAGFWITQANGELAAGGASNAQFNVSWLYVAQDGTIGSSSMTNIIGRFAYWVDDEASKININTAGGLPLPVPVSPDYGTSSNHFVDLSMLLPSPYGLGSAIAAIQGTTGYTTVEEVKRAGPSQSDFTANRFSLTTYSSDGNYPDYTNEFDALDQPRLVLANLHDNLGDSDILGTAGAGVSNAFTYLSSPALATLLTASNTPNAFSDNNKYTPAGLRQIIANIIAYQHDPMNSSDPQAYPPDAGGDPPAYLGLTKAPYVNEVKVQYDASINGGGATQITRTVSVELYYIYGTNGSTYTTGPSDTVVVKNLPVPAFTPPFPAAPAPLPLPGITFTGATPYYTLQFPPDVITLSGVPPPIPFPIPGTTVTNVTVDYYRTGIANRLDCAQVPLPLTSLRAVPTNAWQGAEVNDPCMNDNFLEWTVYRSPTTGGTLAPLGPPSAVGQNSVYSPLENPPSKTLMRAGPMQSVGELGYIHTPTHWTYLTLQPGGGNTAVGQIPDWAMLDLFTVGNAVVTNVATGRININSLINPGTANNPTTPRLVPLEALLNSIVTPSPPVTTAGNIYNNTRAAANTYGMNDPVTLKPIFGTIGEVCEVTGLDNGQTTQAGKEEVIRRIGNLITVRSSTFTVWVMAQTIKQTPTTGIITGEVRVQAVVERYEVAGVPKFRIRYLRYL